MTKQHFQRAAEIVRAIMCGDWPDEPATWVEQPHMYETSASKTVANYTRAVQTAEAFIYLFSAYNDRFDVPKFLVACGLQEKAAKRAR